MCCCSYKLGNSEVHSADEPDAALLTPKPSWEDQPGGQHGGNGQAAPDLQLQSNSSLQQRIQQLEADMIKVSSCVSLMACCICTLCTAHAIVAQWRDASNAV